MDVIKSHNKKKYCPTKNGEHLFESCGGSWYCHRGCSVSETIKPEYLKNMKKKEQLERIAFETTPVIKWECPVCGAMHESLDDATPMEFAQQLYDEGVRWKSMKYMQGVFCKDCYSDPEIQNSSL